MIHPLLILPVPRVEVGCNSEPGIEHLNLLNIFKQQIAVTLLPSRFGKPQLLPAHQRNAVP